MFTFSIDSSMLQQSSESSETDTDTDTDTGLEADAGGSDSSSGQVQDDGKKKTSAEFDREPLGLEEGDGPEWANTDTHCSEAEVGQGCWELDD